MKPLFVVGVALLLSGCGSIITVLRHDSVTTDYLSKGRSYCGAVYSGVMFDFCVLNAGPANEHNYSTSPPIAVVLDLTLPGVVDTVVLPYTLVRQHQDGSIEVN